nr:hypothetical protein [Streptomyces sp. MH191]
MPQGFLKLLHKVFSVGHYQDLVLGLHLKVVGDYFPANDRLPKAGRENEKSAIASFKTFYYSAERLNLVWSQLANWQTVGGVGRVTVQVCQLFTRP